MAKEIKPLLAVEAKNRRLSTLKQNATDGEIIPERDKGEARQKAAELVGTNRQYVPGAKKGAAI